MARFYGTVGFSVMTQREDVFVEEIVERNYYGDVIRNTSRWQSGEYLNDNLALSNSISIVADPYADENFHAIRYVIWMGASWKVTNVEVQRPRLILAIGGVYNGAKGPTTGHT